MPWLQPSETIAERKAEQITCQVSSKGSHKSNGAAERTVQQARGMARVYLEYVREKTGYEFLPRSPWWAWALRHAAWVYNRCHVRADTRVTPHSKIRLKTYAQTVLPFGELVLAPRPGAHFAEKPDTVCVLLLFGQGLSTNTSLGAKLVFSACERSGD